MLFVIIIITLVSLFCYYYSTKELDFWNKRGVKHIKPLPVLGNMLPIALKSVSAADLIIEWYNKFPNERYFGVFNFSDPVLVVKDLELMKRIGVKDFEHFVNHQEMINPDADRVFAKTLFGSNGDRWKNVRRNVSPVFTSNRVRATFALIDDCARAFVDYFKEQENSIIEVEAKDIFERYTNDVVASTALGLEINSLKDKNNNLLLNARKISDFSGMRGVKFFLCGCYPNLTKLLSVKLLSNEVTNFYNSELQKIISTRESNQITGKFDFIDVITKTVNNTLQEKGQDLKRANYSDQKKFLDDLDITAQTVELLIGEFDALSAVLAFTSYELALNPAPQKRLREEIQEVVKENNGQITYDCINNMKYMDQVVNEGLRKWSTTPWINRKCTKRYHIEPKMDGELPLTLEEGQLIWIPTHAIHRDPKYYPNPDVFDPERFNDENRKYVHPFTHFPFGLGPRMCPGKILAIIEFKILLFYLLKDFEIISTSRTEIPLRIGSDNLVMKATNGIHLGLKRYVEPFC